MVCFAGFVHIKDFDTDIEGGVVLAITYLHRQLVNIVGIIVLGEFKIRCGGEGKAPGVGIEGKFTRIIPGQDGVG